MTTEQIVRRLQGEGIVAHAPSNDPGTIIAKASVDAWERFFHSAISEAERKVEAIDDPPMLNNNTAYRIGFKHGLGTALLTIRKMREG